MYVRSSRTRQRYPVGAGSVEDAGAGWTVTVGPSDPEWDDAIATRLTLADGVVGSAGAPPVRRAVSSHRVQAPSFYGDNGARSELVSCPVWTELPFDVSDAARVERRLDLQGGLLHQTVRDGDARIDTVQFASLARRGVVAMRASGDDAVLDGPALREARGTAWASGRSDGNEWIHVVGAHDTLTTAASQLRRPRRLDRIAVYRRGGVAEAIAALEEAKGRGFDGLLDEHRARWADRWETADIVVHGDDDLQLAVRFALFHLMAQTGDGDETALGARGAPGRSYKGHVFWDADVFVLPFLAATHPAAARAMLRYRINRLPAAMAAAQARRREGAWFPWESAVDGRDVTPISVRDFSGRLIPIRNGQKEEHIVADVAWAADRYVAWSGDDVFARGPLRTVLVETARYWASRIRMHDGAAHIYGVIGPDEYHEPVDDNAYTNVMARWNLRRAAAVAGGDVDEAEVRRWLSLAEALVDGYDAATGVYEQFAGFRALEPVLIADISPRPLAADLVLGRQVVRGAQIVKQPDVLMLHHLVPADVAPGSLRPNLDHYEPRTAHGSSLSPGIFAALYARDGRPNRALAYLDVAAWLDLDADPLTGAGGLHIGAMGTVWQALALGFAGLDVSGDRLIVDPRLPAEWDGLDVSLRFRGKAVTVKVRHDGVTVVGDADAEMRS